MPTVSNKKTCQGYLTVYLSLMFAVILSLLLTLIEGAAIGATRLQAELVADLGLDSIFAEYHRELLEQYGVFYIDDSYGNEKGSISRVEQHLSDYVRYNCDPKADGRISLGHNLIKLKNPYLEIDQVSFATDQYGQVWKAQAIECMKEKYGFSYITDIKNYLNVIEDHGLVSRDIMAEIEDKKKEFEAGLRKNEITETDVSTDGGYSYNQITQWLGTVQRIGVTQLIAQDLSNQSVDTRQYIYARSKAGVMNQGCGLAEGIDDPDGIDDEILYGQYLLEYFGNYTKQKEQGLLKYQIEYILYGHDNDAANLQSFVRRMLALRAVSNFIYLNSTDQVKKDEVLLVCEVLCTLMGVPQLAKVLTYIVLGVWSYIEAIADVKGLLQGYKIPLLKEKGQWKTHLWGLLKGVISAGNVEPNQLQTGLSYEDYLRVFLALMNRQDKVMRSLDIVEMDIRQTDGNEYFRIDQCISYLQAGFGFSDAGGRDYVFDRAFGYQ